MDHSYKSKETRVVTYTCKETRVVTYTCRYFSGHLIPNSSLHD